MNQDELTEELNKLKKKVEELERTVRWLKGVAHARRTDYIVKAIGKPLTLKLNIPVVED